MADVCVLAQTESQPTTSFLWYFAERTKYACLASTSVLLIPVDGKLPEDATRESVSRHAVLEAGMTTLGKNLRERLREFVDNKFAEPSEFEHCAMMLVSQSSG